jgi:hypothetical protein
MKKFMIVLLCLVVIMQLAECGEKKEDQVEGSKKTQDDDEAGGKTPGVGGKPDGKGKPTPSAKPLYKRSVDSQLDGNPSERSWAPPDQNARV